MRLTQFPYHVKLTENFKKQEKTWDWFSKTEIQEEQLKKFKKTLLKNTYRLSEDSEAHIYKLLHQAKEKLNLHKEITLYQELHNPDRNARVIMLEEEVHIVVSGNLIKSLNDQELLAVLSHELTHVLFYQLQGGDFEVTNRIIQAIANDPNSSPVMIETARLYQLYIELFCDRGALSVVDDLNTVVEALIKVSTGLEKVSASNYLKQAREIFSDEKEGSNRLTHPETFIRARALELYLSQMQDEGLGENSDLDSDKEIQKMIEQNWSLDKMDLYKQEVLNEMTQKMLQIITKPKWMRTDLVFTHCQNFFGHYSYHDSITIDKDFKDFFDQVDSTIKEYFCYILLDFCLIDSALEKAPIGHTFQVAEALEIEKLYKQIMKKELKSTIKELNKMIEKGVNEVSQLSESEEESILSDA